MTKTCGEACPLQAGGPTHFRVRGEGGWVSIREYHVFPGIWLAFREARVNTFQNHAAYPGGLLEITHCREGRLEYEDGRRAFFLGPGDMSIHKSSADGAVLRCPLRRYQGLSVIIHPDQAPQCASCLLGGVDVPLPELRRKFCGQGRSFVMRSTPLLEHLFSQLYHVPEAIRTGYFKVKVLELLLFLSTLELGPSQRERASCTPAQAQLARDVMAYAAAHRGQRLTAQQLARELHATPEQLRDSVRRVYGKPLYQCVRAYKMEVAARLLLETARTVMDIAGELGYDNSSKFASAFREVKGLSPGEFRQRGPQPPFWSEEPPFWSG